MPLSIHKEALKRNPRNVRYFQPGAKGGKAFIKSQTEHNFRALQPGTPAEVPATKAGGSGASPPITITKPPPVGPDRWHKEGYDYVTVSKQHLVGEDPVLDPSQKHTLNDGYTEALRLEALMTSNGDSRSRIKVEVHSGLYSEDIICTSSRIDLIGIGKPVIEGSITVDTACTKVLIDNFIIENTIDDTAPPLLALNILSGTSSGDGISDIQFRDCLVRGTSYTHINRWSYFENCEFRLKHTGTSPPVVIVQFDLSMVEWTIFRNCLFRADQSSDWRSRGQALQIKAIDDHGLWYPNDFTYGSGSFAKTGVLLDHCEIDGFSSNYGWNLEYAYCRGIQGQIIDDTSGSYHHEIHCNSDQSVQAYTWFHHSIIESRYIAHPIDDSILGTGGTFNIWIDHTQHTAPDGGAIVQAGTSVWNTAAPICTGNVYVSFSNTHAKVWYSVAAVEGAALLLLSGGQDSNSADNTIGGTQQIFYKQGYQNWP